MGPGSPIEALKAQAIATRTITISKINSGKHRDDFYHLCSTTHCQVYRGLSGQNETTKRAALETRNLILVHNENPIEALYSSHCGGLSECPGNLWSSRLDYTTTKPDSYCIDVKIVPNWNQRFINWEKEFSFRDLEQKFNIRNISEIYVSRRNSGSRAEEITIRSATRNFSITGQYEIRNTFGLSSSLFLILDSEEGFLFIGNGYGHGVGMCQTGAIARANSGHSYIEILEFYFEGAEIVTNTNIGIQN
jgi:stage II sporulation protein D